MMPPPRGMLIRIVAVLDESVPLLLSPVALTVVAFAGFTLTVICVLSGTFEQCTTIDIGLLCCAESSVSGVASCPLGDTDTGTPPTLVTVNCVPCPFVGMIIGW